MCRLDPLSVRRVSWVTRGHEANATPRRPWIDGESVAVDHNVVVVPTERDEVVGVGAAPLAVGDPVVGLEPVHRLAPVSGATAITVDHEAPQPRWDHP